MRGRLPLTLFAVSLAGCVTIRRPAPGTPPGPEPAPPRPGEPAPSDGARADEAAALEAAVAAVDLERPDAGRAALESFVARHPRSAQRPVAQAHLARLALAAGDPRRARSVLPTTASDGAGVVTFVQGLVEARVGQPARALELLAPFADGPPARIPDRDDAELALQAALAEARLGAGDPGGALVAWESYGGRRAKDAEKAYAQDRADELAARLPDEEAARLYESLRRDFARAALGPHAAAALRARGDATGARRLDEETAALRRSLGWMSGPKALGPGDPFRLGLLAPFSGSAALLGEIILRGAMMAIGDRGGQDGAGRFQIVARDAAVERGPGERVADEIVREEAAVAVVGAGDRGAALAAARDGVPVLMLDEAAPGAGSTAFQVLHPLEVRAAELARRALALGAKRFAILAPESPAGRRLQDAFARAVTAGGGRVAAQATYPAGASAFVAPIGRIRRASFEAIFVADDAARLELIAPALAAADLWAQPYGAPCPGPAAAGSPVRRPVLLVSTAVGAGPQLLRNAGRYVQGALLAPGFFADPDDARTSAFVTEFRTLYGQDPGAADAYGYDAFRMLVSAILRGGKSRAELLRTLASEPFEGVTGTVRFGPDHTRIDPPPVYVVAGDSIRSFR